jgi:type I restriction enzyme M protein
LGDAILKTFESDALLNPYDMYQHLMTYWEEVMQDDFYTIAMEGWEAGKEWEREIIKGKKGKDGKSAKDRAVGGLEGIIGKMIPPHLLIQEYLAEQWEAVTDFEAQIESAKAELDEMQQETEVENGIFSDLDKVNLTSVKGLLKQRKSEKAPKEEIAVIENYINLNEAISSFSKLIKIQKETIEKLVIELYPKLSESEIKDLVVSKKWFKHLEECLHEEKERMSQTLTQRIVELAERYKNTLPEMELALNEYETKVKSHLQKMGWQW